MTRGGADVADVANTERLGRGSPALPDRSSAGTDIAKATMRAMASARRPRVRRRRPLVERLAATAVALFLVDLGCVAGLLFVTHDWMRGLTFGSVLLLTRASQRLYRPRIRLSWLDDLPRSLASVTIAAGACALVFAVAQVDAAAVATFLRAAVGFTVVNETARLLVLALLRQSRRLFGLSDATLVLGAGVVGRAMASAMLAAPELGLRPVGFLDPDPRQGNDTDLPVLSRSRSELADLILRHRVGTVVVSFAANRESELVDTVITAHQMDCTVLVVPRMYELHSDGPDVERLQGYPLVRLNPDPTSRLAWWLKRLLDVTVAAAAILLLSPVLALAALAVFLESGRPLLFHQTRIGLDSRPFRIHKLRSLRPENESESQTRWSIATDLRVGRTGRFLRKTSIDELPQLWNILRGEMSYVGPRPERPGFVEVFSIEHERYWARHRVPVGLTGLAQVNGLRGDTSIADRARFDNYYIANWSLWLDVRIIILTVREVLRGGGG